jgi:hypothetical protein
VDSEIKWAEVEDLRTVGIDEMALKKGRKTYAAIVTGRQANGKIGELAVLPDRKKEPKRLAGPKSGPVAAHHQTFQHRYVGGLRDRH